jgi:hypothetical protein
MDGELERSKNTFVPFLLVTCAVLVPRTAAFGQT